MTYWVTATKLAGNPSAVALHELQAQLLDRIDTLRSEYRALETGDSGTYGFATDASVTLSIIGERGSGKTTLLVDTCRRLSTETDHLVLPVMRPELFSDNESVLSSFLASVWAKLYEAGGQGSEINLEGPESHGAADRPPERRSDLLSLIAETSRTQAKSRIPLTALEHGTTGPIDYAEDAIQVSRSSTRLDRQLRRLVSVICREDSRQRLIICPIDDPDLAPRNIIGILRDLRLLGSIPGLVPLVCLSERDLAGALHLETARNQTKISWEEQRRYGREIMKVLPYSSRFEIGAITTNQRIGFRPMGEDANVKACLNGLNQQLETLLGGQFRLGEGLELEESVFGLSSPLPSTPRALVQLWQTLEAVTQRAKLSDLTATAKRMIDILSEDLRIASRLDGQDLYEYGLPFDGSSSATRSLRFNLDSWSLRIAADGNFSGRRRFAPSRENDDPQSPRRRSVSVQLRNIARILIRHHGAATTDESVTPLDPSAAAAFLALQEIAIDSGLFQHEGDRLMLGLSEFSWLQVVSFGPFATDDAFMTLPNATSLTDVLNTGKSWEDLVEFQSQAETDDALLIRVIDHAVANCLREPVVNSDSYERAVEKATDLYGRLVIDRETGPSRERQYCDWYESSLPLQWHASLLSNSVIRRCTERYVRELKAAERWVTESNRLAIFDGRLQPIVDAASEEDSDSHVWIAGYFDAASALESKHTEALADLSQSWSLRLASLHAGSAATGDVLAGRADGNFAPYVTPDNERLLAAALEALRRLERRATADLQQSRGRGS